MLDEYAVMRSPTTTANRLPASQRLGPWSAYGRVAQRRYGFAIEVIPQPFNPPLGRPITVGCEMAQLAALRKEMAGAPKGLIARAVRINQEIFEDERYTQQHPDGICLSVGAGSCGSFLDAQARGELTTRAYRAHGSISADLVPDGVAKITVHYPVERSANTPGRTIPALTISVPVINNVAVWAVPNRGNLQLPGAVTWLANNGKTIRTTYPDS